MSVKRKLNTKSLGEKCNALKAVAEPGFEENFSWGGGGGGQRKSKKAHYQIEIIKNMIIVFSVSEARCSYLALLFQPQNVLLLFLFCSYFNVLTPFGRVTFISKINITRA